MAALLGMVLGAGLHMEGAKLARQRQMDDLLLQGAMQNPIMATDPDIQKVIAKRGSPELAKYLGAAGQHALQVQQQMTAALGGGGDQGAAAPPMGAGPAAAGMPGAPTRGGPGLMLPKIGGGQLPAQLPMTSITGPSGQAVPGTTAGPMGGGGSLPSAPAPAAAPPTTSAPAPSGGGQAAAGASSDDWTAHINQIDGEINRLRRIQAAAASNPAGAAYMPILSSHISDLEKQRDTAIQQQFHHQEHQETMGQQRQFHEEHEEDVQLAREQSRQLREVTQAQSAENQRFQRDMETQRLDLEKSKDREIRGEKVAAMGKSIDDHRDKIIADFSKLTDDQKPAAEARVKGYNATAQQFYTRHADAGAPTLLKFTPAVPGTGARGWAGGTAFQPATIEAVPPQYGSVKGKTGWLDANGNFYPDAGTD